MPSARNFRFQKVYFTEFNKMQTMKFTNTKFKLIFSATLILIIFIFTSFFVIKKFNQKIFLDEDKIMSEQSSLLATNLKIFFDKLIFVVESTASSPAFTPEKTIFEDKQRYDSVPLLKTEELITKWDVPYIIEGDNISFNLNHNIKSSKQKKHYNWQIFKGLPPVLNNHLTIERRSIFKSITKSFEALHNIFQIEANGNIIMLEPFDVQKTLTSFNYSFRDYLKRVLITKKTRISEAYISHDKERSQLITTTSPVFNNEKKIHSIIGLSISTKTFREQILNPFKNSVASQAPTQFYFIDRHGHVIASTDDSISYYPSEESITDNNDKGNIRNYLILKDIAWKDDLLESGNKWQRITKSWDESKLKKNYIQTYFNHNNVLVRGHFAPLAIIGTEQTNWGILIEVPISHIQKENEYLKKIFIFSGILLLIVISTLIITALKSYQNLENSILSKERELGLISAQVAHDIRSPLASLQIVAKNLMTIPEEHRLIIKSATQRINDIATHLIDTYKLEKSFELSKNNLFVTPYLIAPVISSVITEKRIQFRHREDILLEFSNKDESYGLFTNINPSIISRIVSNLLNNSFEAMEPTENKSKISISFHKTEAKEIIISITDQGSGFSMDMIKLINSDHSISNKKDGLGLGLSSARSYMQKIQGQLHISNNPTGGSQIKLHFKASPPPEWFVPMIDLKNKKNLIIIDDDESIYLLWKQRLDRHIQLIHFKTIKDFESYYTQKGDHSNSFILFDFEFLGDRRNGAETIIKHQLQHNSILVTSRSEDSTVLAMLIENKIKMLPKAFAATIPINL
jgi:signal transduction histidine kinase